MPDPFHYCGVIEGFYGRPWTPPQRVRLLDWMRSWGMNTYLYAPKDDIKHRALWREPYDPAELAALQSLVAGCRERGIRFVYAIAPGLDIRYASELPVLQAKLSQVAALQVSDFAVLFDDIPQAMQPADAAQFGTFAAAQVHIANALAGWLRQEQAAAELWFCPTVYCGRFAGHDVPGNAYLQELGRSLDPAVEVLWTGPEIVPETIPVESIREVARVLRRPPIIWENLHANDYDLRRMYLGPFAGRDPGLRAEVRGVLSNPNCEFEANFVPLHTLAAWARTGAAWNEAAALDAACADWRPAFRSRLPVPFSEQDLRWLVDLFHLPYADGPRAARLLEDARFMLDHPVMEWCERYGRFERACDEILGLSIRLTELEDRDLCFTFLRHVAETNREVQVLRGYLNWLRTGPPAGAEYSSPTDCRPRLYRGGIAAQVQRLTVMDGRGMIGKAG